MADVAKLIEEHLQHRIDMVGEPSFARCLTISDKFEAHGMGIILEELLTTKEMAEYLQRFIP